MRRNFRRNRGKVYLRAAARDDAGVRGSEKEEIAGCRK